MAPKKFTKSSFVQNLAKGNLLAPFLDRYDGWDHPFTFDYSPKEGDEGWHPSGDCTPSVLALYEKALGAPQPFDTVSPSLQRTFLVGHFWHQVIQDALVRMEFAEPSAIERKGYHGWSKTPVETYQPYHYATGSGDVAPLVLPNWTGILDIKTMHEQAFNGVVKSGQLPPNFAAKYECQINIYMDFFDQEHGMILGVNKGTSSFCEVTFDRNQELIDTIYEKWKYVSESLDSGTTPLDDADKYFELPLKGTA